MVHEVIIHLGYGITDMDTEMFLDMEYIAGAMDMTCFGLDHFIITFTTGYSSHFGIIWAGMDTVITMVGGQEIGMEMDIITITPFTEILI
jgi:hypothetical protein